MFLRYSYKLNVNETDLLIYSVGKSDRKYVYSYGYNFPYKIYVSFYEIVPNTSIYNILYKDRIIGYTKKDELKVLIEPDIDNWW